MYIPYMEDFTVAKTDWFTQDRFGMFIHWGLYAIPARGEWVRSNEKIPPESYRQYFHAFDPVDYDPKAWARAAREAGMKYAVITAKHHDGFCLFDSKLTDYKATNTKAKRDLILEYTEAFRAEGLKVGLYYSLLDWNHPDYPHYGDRHHPMREDVRYAGKEHCFSKYLSYMHGQVEELCVNYGKIDLFWFDFSYDGMYGEAWKATELVRMVRRYWPDILIDNRLEGSGDGYGSLLTGKPSEYSGDFVCPEQNIPLDGVRDINGESVLWEACVTMNNNWGYCEADRNYKPAGMLIKKLVECVSKGGNFLLNVGPDARGKIPSRSLDILAGIGAWMRSNGESVYGCGRAGIDKPEYGRITRRGNTLYYHIMENQIGSIPLPGISPGQVKRAWYVSSGAELKLSPPWYYHEGDDAAYISLGDSPLLHDPADTVVAVEVHDNL